MDHLANEKEAQAEERERVRARALVKEIEDEWCRIVEDGVRSGEFREPNPRQAGIAVLSLVISVWRWYREDGDLSLSEISAYLVRACRRLIDAQ